MNASNPIYEDRLTGPAVADAPGVFSLTNEPAVIEKSLPSLPSAPSTVLMVGPPEDQIGGIASVIRLMSSLKMYHRYTFEHFATTHRPQESEPFYARCARHLRHLKSLRREIRQHDIDLVHIHTCSGASFYRSAFDLLVAQQSSARVVLHIHGAKFDHFFENEPSYRKRWITWVLGRADAVIALSDQWRTLLREMAPLANIVTVENAIEIPPLSTRNQKDGPCRFTLLAKMDQWKGIEELLQACRLLHIQQSDFLLTMAGPAGSAGDQHSLSEKINDLGLASVVRYVGPVMGNAKTRLLANSDVYVQPSHHEGMPIAILEAMSHGLPIVATKVGAIPEMVKDGTHGKLVAVKDATSLAAALRELLKESDTRRVMGNVCRDLAESRFGEKRLASDLVELYDTVRATPLCHPLHP